MIGASALGGVARPDKFEGTINLSPSLRVGQEKITDGVLHQLRQREPGRRALLRAVRQPLGERRGASDVTAGR